MESKNNNKNGMNVIENKENEVKVTEESRKGIRPTIHQRGEGMEAGSCYPFRLLPQRIHQEPSLYRRTRRNGSEGV